VALLDVDGLRVVRHRWPVVDGVTFSVAEGEMVAVAGPRGAGKSALLACLAGAITAASGEVSFEGRPVTHDDVAKRVRRGIAWVPPGWTSKMTVGQHLRLGARSGGLGRQAARTSARNASSLFGDAVATRRRRVAALDKKDRVLVGLARAMASHPRLILVDSPTAGLSAADAADVASKLGDLTGAGVAVIVAEHAGPVVLDADRVIVLDHGRVVRDGEPREQYERLLASYLGASA
jgi:ABC-type branched-subunit amino acid transport system ATPase component